MCVGLFLRDDVEILLIVLYDAEKLALVFVFCQIIFQKRRFRAVLRQRDLIQAVNSVKKALRPPAPLIFPACVFPSCF